MKAIRLFYVCAASAALSSCTSQIIDEGDEQRAGGMVDSVANVRLHCATLDVSTRAALTANGKSMTDLYVMDYDQGTGQLLQVLHQTADSEDFGMPVLTMGYGTHTVKVLATRSEGSTLVDTNGDTWITTPGMAQPVEADDVPSGWSSNKTSDTFCAAKNIQVASSTSGAAVDLDRGVAKLSLIVRDHCPEDCSTLSLLMDEYHTLPWATMEPSLKTESERVSDVTMYAGRDGFTMSYYFLVPNEGYTTDVTITVGRTGAAPYAVYDVAGVKLERNKVTEIVGDYYSGTEGLTITLNDAWQEDRNVVDLK